jgi:hypothetical protein
MKKIFFVLAMIMASALLYAAVNDSASIIFPVLDMGAGARAVGMGGAYTAVADDASAIYWNAAGLGDLRDTQVELTYDKWFLDTMFSQALVAVPLPAGTLGAEIVYMNLGDVPVRDIFGTTTSIMNPYLLGGSIGYGINFGGLSAGATLKVISQAAGNITNAAFAGDAGVLLRTGIFSAGVNLQNVGNSGEYSLPMNIKDGIALQILNSTRHRLLIALDSQYLFKNAFSISAGAEYVYSQILALRVGYNRTFVQSDLEGLTGLSGGIGVKFQNLGLDYAIAPYGDLGVTHRFTLSYVFSQPAAEPVADENTKKAQAKQQYRKTVKARTSAAQTKTATEEK